MIRNGRAPRGFFVADVSKPFLHVTDVMYSRVYFHKCSNSFVSRRRTISSSTDGEIDFTRFGIENPRDARQEFVTFERN